MKRTFCFDVRETITRTAYVEAGSAAEARELLVRWGNGVGDLAEDGPIMLGDYRSDGFTFRSVKDPSHVR